MKRATVQTCTHKELFGPTAIWAYSPMKFLRVKLIFKNKRVRFGSVMSGSMNRPSRHHIAGRATYMGPRTCVIYNAIQRDIHDAWRDGMGRGKRRDGVNKHRCESKAT